MTTPRLPYLHRKPLSRQKAAARDTSDRLGANLAYDYGQGQNGAAWHAVAMARADKEAE